MDEPRRLEAPGLVFVGLSGTGCMLAEKINSSAFRRQRETIQERSANHAFDLLRRRLLDGR